eukprot:m.181534 g.181534  ORF g.181534 m.181534 type:complete len:118 (+) comp39277_c0_seq2:785-1138(+)
MSALGGFILFFGFLLFISGRHRSISLPEDGTIFGRIAINTLVSGSASAVTSLILASVINRRHNSEEERLIATLNGCLAGLVRLAIIQHAILLCGGGLGVQGGGPISSMGLSLTFLKD